MMAPSPLWGCVLGVDTDLIQDLADSRLHERPPRRRRRRQFRVAGPGAGEFRWRGGGDRRNMQASILVTLIFEGVGRTAGDNPRTPSTTVLSKIGARPDSSAQTRHRTRWPDRKPPSIQDYVDLGGRRGFTQLGWSPEGEPGRSAPLPQERRYRNSAEIADRGTLLAAMQNPATAIASSSRGPQYKKLDEQACPEGDLAAEGWASRKLKQKSRRGPNASPWGRARDPPEFTHACLPTPLP